MITLENLKDVIFSLDAKDKNRILNSTKEYCVLELHIFNVGSYSTIKLTNNFNRYQNVAANGNAILETSEVQYILNNY